MADLTLPAGVVTMILVLPGAVSGTIAVIWVSESTWNVAAAVPDPTSVAPVKWVPVITTALPVPLVVGVNEVIVGLAATDLMNWVALVAVPVGVVTLILPLAGAPAGTAAVICVSESMWKVAAAPPNVTPVAPVKWVPVITTDVPVLTLVGVNDVIAGLATTGRVNGVAQVAFPMGVVTEILPLAGAVAGTVAVIWVSESTWNAATAVPNLTPVVPVNPLPVITTDAPAPPDPGVKDVIVSAAPNTTDVLTTIVATTSAMTRATLLVILLTASP